MVMEGPEVVGREMGDKERLNKRLGLALSIKHRSFRGGGGDKVPKNCANEHRNEDEMSNSLQIFPPLRLSLSGRFHQFL